MGKQGIALEYQAKIPLVHSHPGHVFPVQGKGAALRVNESRHHPEGRGLAAAAWPQKGYQFPLFHLKVKAF